MLSAATLPRRTRSDALQLRYNTDDYNNRQEQDTRWNRQMQVVQRKSALRCAAMLNRITDPEGDISPSPQTRSRRHTLAASALHRTCLDGTRPAILPKEALLTRAEIMMPDGIATVHNLLDIWCAPQMTTTLYDVLKWPTFLDCAEQRYKLAHQ